MTIRPPLFPQYPKKKEKNPLGIAVHTPSTFAPDGNPPGLLGKADLALLNRSQQTDNPHGFFPPFLS
jgi:hypothetical protein